MFNIGPQACNLIIKRLQHRCFPVKFVKFFKNTYSEEPILRAIASISGDAALSLRPYLAFTEVNYPIPPPKNYNASQKERIYLVFISKTKNTREKETKSKKSQTETTKWIVFHSLIIKQ